MLGLAGLLCGLMVLPSMLTEGGKWNTRNDSCRSNESHSDSACSSCQGIPVTLLNGSRWPNLTVPYNISLQRNSTCDMVRWSLDSESALSVQADQHYLQIEGWNKTADRYLDPNVNFISISIVPGVDDYELAMMPGTLNDIVEIAVYWDIVRKEQGVYGFGNYSRYSIE